MLVIRFFVVSFVIFSSISSAYSMEFLKPSQDQKNLQRPKIFVSIPFIAFLVQDIAQNDFEIVSTQQTSCLHDHSLLPQDRKALLDSDAWIWLGPQIEPYWQKTALEVQLKKMKQKDLSLTKQLKWLPNNIHFWLDVSNAQRVTQEIQSFLSTLNPAKTKIYQNRSENLIAKLEKLKQTNKQTKSLIILDNVFDYWLDSRGIKPKFQLTTHGQAQLTPKRWVNLMNQLKTDPPQCLMASTDTPKQLVQRIQQLSSAKVIQLTPVGIPLSNTQLNENNNQTNEQQKWFSLAFFNQLDQNLKACLTKN
jgi:ABC-type Zn uptake system ZnuABC Zn-binding protein ZnuA